jgi:hypothetical protein
MSRLLILTLLVAACTTSFAQRKPKQTNDPSYSVRNYKHADKAVWAAENKQGEFTTLDNAILKDQRDYKNPFSNKATKKAVVATFKKASTPAASHKHPLGI